MTSVIIQYDGSIGDTIVILPLLPWIRRAFPERKIIFFHTGVGYQISKEILEPTGFCDSFYPYEFQGKSLIERLSERVRAWLFLRRVRAKDLVWMPRTFYSSQAQIDKLVKKHTLLYRSAGVTHFFGMGRREVPTGKHRHVLSLLAEELRKSGIYVPEDSALTWDYNFTELEVEHARSAIEKFPFHVEDAVAIGCGGKQPANWWPENFWIDLVTWLTTEKKAKIIFLGGPNDEEKIERLRKLLPPDSSASLTTLSVRETLIILKHCRCYIGHDTGTIHMAASVGLQCFGIFSSHDPKKLWEPWSGTGVQHHVFRQDIECSPCIKHVCPKGCPSPCISGITPEIVKNELQKHEFFKTTPSQT